ncbi:hypothetical protein QBC35DRAFT_476116 [Podospora australis]|uniref:Uncharacterized protein n=1 Tax=Podospora australis TaxID=1536484 RepID=A0AAN6WP21_9PEZI|nr:hypothetical protein QBC35DRAFT_476116 [Podospora australis]
MNHLGFLWALVMLCFARLGASLGGYATPYQYWIHPQSTQKDPGFESYVTDALYMVRSAYSRVNDIYDGDFMGIFWLIFKIAPWTTTQFNIPDFIQEAWGGPHPRTAQQIVNDTMFSMTWEWVHNVDNGNQAHLQFWCDNGARYVKAPDKTGYSYDPANGVYIEDAGEHTQDCIDPDQVTFALTSPNIRAFDPSSDGTIPLWVTTIDICDDLWGHLNRNPVMPNGVPVPRSLDQWHQLNEYDISNLGDLSIVMKLTTQQALFDPEAYAYLGLWAAMADQTPHWGNKPGQRRKPRREAGYTIDRSWAQLPDDVKWQDMVPDPQYGQTPNWGFLGAIVTYQYITGTKNPRPPRAASRASDSTANFVNATHMHDNVGPAKYLNDTTLGLGSLLQISN